MIITVHKKNNNGYLCKKRKAWTDTCTNRISKVTCKKCLEIYQTIPVANEVKYQQLIKAARAKFKKEVMKEIQEERKNHKEKMNMLKEKLKEAKKIKINAPIKPLKEVIQKDKYDPEKFKNFYNEKYKKNN